MNTENPQNIHQILTFICDLKIGLITFEVPHINLIHLSILPIVQLLDPLTFDWLPWKCHNSVLLQCIQMLQMGYYEVKQPVNYLLRE